MTRSHQIAFLAKCLQTLKDGKASLETPSDSHFRSAELIVNCMAANGKKIADA